MNEIKEQWLSNKPNKLSFASATSPVFLKNMRIKIGVDTQASKLQEVKFVYYT